MLKRNWQGDPWSKEVIFPKVFMFIIPSLSHPTLSSTSPPFFTRSCPRKVISWLSWVWIRDDQVSEGQRRRNERCLWPVAPAPHHMPGIGCFPSVAPSKTSIHSSSYKETLSAIFLPPSLHHHFRSRGISSSQQCIIPGCNFLVCIPNLLTPRVFLH